MEEGFRGTLPAEPERYLYEEAGNIHCDALGAAYWTIFREPNYVAANLAGVFPSLGLPLPTFGRRCPASIEGCTCGETLEMKLTHLAHTHFWEREDVAAWVARIGY